MARLNKKRRPPANTHEPQQPKSLLRKRLDEINARSEKELAAIFESIEKVKAAFRSQRP